MPVLGGRARLARWSRSSRRPPSSSSQTREATPRASSHCPTTYCRPSRPTIKNSSPSGVQRWAAGPRLESQSSSALTKRGPRLVPTEGATRFRTSGRPAAWRFPLYGKQERTRTHCRVLLLLHLGRVARSAGTTREGDPCAAWHLMAAAHATSMCGAEGIHTSTRHSSTRSRQSTWLLTAYSRGARRAPTVGCCSPISTPPVGTGPLGRSRYQPAQEERETDEGPRRPEILRRAAAGPLLITALTRHL